MTAVWLHAKGAAVQSILSSLCGLFEHSFLRLRGIFSSMSSYTRKAVYGFAWIAFGALIANVFGYLLRLLLARSLTVEEYGLIYAVMALFGLVSILQSMGLGESLVKYASTFAVKDDLKRTKESITWAALILYACTAITLVMAFVLADWLGTAYFKNPYAPSLIRILAIVVFLSPIETILLAVMQGRQKLHLHATFMVIRSIGLFLATWFFIVKGFGAKSAMYAYLVTYVLSYFLLFPYFFSKAMPGFFSIKTKLDPKTPRMLLAYGIPVMLTSVAGTILMYTDTLMITLFTGLEQVGQYQAALPTANVMLFLVGVLSTVMLPLTAELWERGKKDKIEVALRELFLYGFIGILPVIIAAVIFPELILNLLFGATYIVGAPILRMLSFSVLVLTINAMMSSTLSGIGRPQDNTKAVIVGATLNLLSNLILIPRFGGLGAAISTLLSSIVIFAVSFLYLSKHVRISLPILAWGKALFAGALFAIVIWGSRFVLVGMNQYLKVSIAVVFGALVYVMVIFLLRAITVIQAKGFLRQVIKK